MFEIVFFIIGVLTASLPVFIIYIFFHRVLRQHDYDWDLSQLTYLAVFEIIWVLYWLLLSFVGFASGLDSIGLFLGPVSGLGALFLLFLMSLYGTLYGLRHKLSSRFEKVSFGANVLLFFLIMLLPTILLGEYAQ